MKTFFFDYFFFTEVVTKSVIHMNFDDIKYTFGHLHPVKIRSACTFAQLGPEVIKLFSCSDQLSMTFVLLINLKLLTISNSFLLNIAEHENFSANKYENANYYWHFHIY